MAITGEYDLIDVQCQKDDWKLHRKECEMWRLDRREVIRVIENTRRAEMSAFLGFPKG